MKDAELAILIIDDERPARSDLKRILSRLDGVRVVGEAADGVAGVKLVKRLEPDIVLLDIQMPGLDGFQVLEKLAEEGIMPFIIFVTAYDEYAIKAFEVNAVDYLLKPVEEERLSEAVKRAREAIAQAKGHADVEALLSTLRQEQKRIALRVGESIVLVDSDDILYATISSGEVKVVTEEVEGIPNVRSLDELLGELGSDNFVRVHRAYIANIKKIYEIEPWFNGSYRVKMKDRKGPIVPLSRQRAKELRKRVKW